jgi:hypothetical protein
MKFTWEVDDIRAGRRVTAWNDTEEYVIGYDHRIIDPQQHLALISLADGIIVEYGLSRVGMKNALNKSGMRPVTVEKEKNYVRG